MLLSIQGKTTCNTDPSCYFKPHKKKYIKKLIYFPIVFQYYTIMSSLYLKLIAFAPLHLLLYIFYEKKKPV